MKSFIKTFAYIGVIVAVIILAAPSIKRTLGESTNAASLEIYFLDVGQGDSMLIKSPDGHYGLVDGGKGVSVIEELQEVLPFGFPGFDFVMISHSDSDHMGGIDDVIYAYDVDNLIWNDTGKENSGILELEKLVSERGIQRLSMYRGDILEIGCCLLINSVWPNVEDVIAADIDENDLSIGFILDYKNFQAISEGDLGKEFEIKSTQDIPDRYHGIELYKINHHGSKTSTSAEYLELVSPQLGVIPVGKNSYGHPNTGVLDLLQLYDIDIMRTDLQGRIKVSTDGEQVEVTSERGDIVKFQAN